MPIQKNHRHESGEYIPGMGTDAEAHYVAVRPGAEAVSRPVLHAENIGWKT